MTANLEALLPGTTVLLDIDGACRGDRGIVLRQVEAPLGDGVTVEVCVQPCRRETHSIDVCNAIGFSPDELLLVPEPGALTPEAAPPAGDRAATRLPSGGAAAADGLAVT